MHIPLHDTLRIPSFAQNDGRPVRHTCLKEPARRTPVSTGHTMQFAVGFKVQGKTGHVIVDAEDALIAALKVKMRHPEALIAYVRRENKRGDSRHPMHGLSAKNG